MGTVQLSQDEAQALARCEAVIEAGLGTFVQVGRALLEIRDRRLYRDRYSTFAAYCAARWGIGRAHAYRLMNAAVVAANVSPAGDIPAAEAQARPLTSLPAAVQQAVWTVIRETAPSGRVTTAHVQAVASVMRDLLASGAVTDGEGRSVVIADLLRAAITEEHYERWQRQRTHLASAMTPRQYMYRRALLTPALLVELAALAGTGDVWVSVWKEVNDGD